MRREDWPERLAAFLDERATAPFVWGRNDCVTFAADWILDATGVDVIADIRGKWRSESGAARTIRKLGGLAAATSLRLAPVGLGLAHRGDVGLIDLGLPALVIIDGDLVAGPGVAGIVRARRENLIAAWEV